MARNQYTTEKDSNRVKTKVLARVVRKDGGVVAIETLKDVWILAQFVGRTRMAFFDAFAKNREFSVEQWSGANLLFINAVTNQFLRSSTVYTVDLAGKKNLPTPTAWINTKLFGQTQKTVLWEGTDFERHLIVEYGGVLHDESNNILIKRIRRNDRETIDNHELSGSAVYPYTNHRLYLCYQFGRNVDPMKELAFRRSLPVEYAELIRRLYPEDHF